MSQLKITAKIIVQKYGGATLATPEKIKGAAKRIADLHNLGTPLVVVVSAMGQTTNELIKLAHQISDRPCLRELDMLLSVGERISMSLLSMALNDLGCPAISFTGSQAGIMTDDAHVNANITEVRAIRVEEALKENKVVILAGFQGVSAKTKEITTLGRGGSDISAVAMAAYLKAARCEILKDVDCIYTADPKTVPNAKPIPQLNYSQLIDMTKWGAKVLHQRSVQLAADEGVTLFVGPAEDEQSTGTLVSPNFSFPKQQPVALNSYARVFEVKFRNELKSFADLQTHLRENQVGQAQLLHTEREYYYITAPQEILEDLLNFAKSSTRFSITNSELSSVSLTFAKPCTAAEFTLCREPLDSSGISPAAEFMAGNNANFVLTSEKRNETLKRLHDRFFS